ncbi:MAG: tyrosine-type recombinase/integrase [candidate division Zixibacteria bacterium]|nr:tyrosine-type recombinase/integrase [candidate division Zixibacteria bacterium]
MENRRTSDLLESFICDCHYRNLSEKAIAEYRWYLLYIKKQCGDLLAVDRQMIKQLVIDRLGAGLSPVTVNHYVKAIKVFYSFLLREEIIADNPMAKLAKVIEPKKVKSVLDVDKVSRLIAIIPSRTFYHARDKAMITLIWDTAIRLKEVLLIHASDLNLQFRTIKIKGKGNKERVVPFGQKAKRELIKYLKFRDSIDSTFIFCARDGLSISPRNFQRTLTKYGNKIGIKVSPHLLRHSSATFLAKSEMPAQHIQILLGHSSLSTTQRYINQIVNQEGLKSAIGGYRLEIGYVSLIYDIPHVTRCKTGGVYLTLYM